jgi:hypothetical protein
VGIVERRLADDKTPLPMASVEKFLKSLGCPVTRWCQVEKSSKSLQCGSRPYGLLVRARLAVNRGKQLCVLSVSDLNAKFPVTAHTSAKTMEGRAALFERIKDTLTEEEEKQFLDCSKKKKKKEKKSTSSSSSSSKQAREQVKPSPRKRKGRDDSGAGASSARLTKKRKTTSTATAEEP